MSDAATLSFLRRREFRLALNAEAEAVNCGLSNLFETAWVPACAGMTEGEDDELRLEENFLTGGSSAISGTFSLMNSPLTKSPTGERMEEKTPAVCLEISDPHIREDDRKRRRV